MRAYVVRRALLLVPTLLGISLLAFALANLTPGDPAEEFLRRTLDRPPTPAEVAEVREELGLDRPLVVQYVTWATDAVRGDLGLSYSTRRPVAAELAYRIPFTLELALPAALLALAIALPVGVIAAIHRNRVVDQVVRVVSLMGGSIPSFWLALILISVFAVKLSLIPVAGRAGLPSLVLPVITLALVPAAVLARFTRSTMLETLGEDYIRTASAKGLRERLVIGHHALRNSLVPVVTAFGTTVGYLVTQAVIVETIFVWPGVGRLMLEAIHARDYPVIQGVVIFSGTAFVVINLLVDLSYAVLDPRVRLGGRAAS